jgi:hypothetical protein
MTNRVDELESQVAQLQATVNGLTEELVEAKERLRLIEDAVDVDLTTGTRSVGHGPDDAQGGSDADEAAADGATERTVDRGSDPLVESPAQTVSRSRTSDTPSDDASFIDADAGAAGSTAAPAEQSGAQPTGGQEPPAGDGTKSGEAEDGDEATTTDDDIIVA